MDTNQSITTQLTGADKRAIIKSLIWIVVIIVAIIFIAKACSTNEKHLDPEKVLISDIIDMDTGEKTGEKYGNITIKAKDIQKLKYDEIKNFENWVKTQQGTLKYVTIITGSNDNGTEFGIVFRNCDPNKAMYGSLDIQEDLIDPELGNNAAVLEDKGTYYVLNPINKNDAALGAKSSETKPKGINGLPIIK